MYSFENAGNVGNQFGKTEVKGSMYNGPVNQLFFGDQLKLLPHQVKQQLEILDANILRSLAFREMFDRRANVEQPYPATCNWIFTNDQYMNWQAECRGLFWVKGKPGAGKSTLMLWLYTKLRASKSEADIICLDFFFNARGTELQHTTTGMLRALLNQLFSQEENVRDIVRRPFQEKSSAFGRNDADWEWHRPELELIFQEALSKAAMHRGIFILIDGLDEAGEEHARGIAKYFHRLNDLCTKASGKVQICISCRHYPIISAIKSYEVSVDHHNQNDIRLLIQNGLGLDHLSNDDDQRRGWQALQNSLVDQARGVFQWIHLVVPMVRKAIDDGESLAEVQSWVSNVPQELTSVYRHIITNVISRRSIEQSMILFLWVILAQRQLCLQELGCILYNKAVTLELKSTEELEPSVLKQPMGRIQQQVNALSGGLIEVINAPKNNIEAPDRYVQVVHQSVNDFFLTDGLSLLASLQTKTRSTLSDSDGKCRLYPSNVSQGHTFIYWSCLKLLALPPTIELPMPSQHDRGQAHIEKLNCLNSDEYYYMRLKYYRDLHFKRCKYLQSYPIGEYVQQHLLTHARLSHACNVDEIGHEIQLLESVMPWPLLCEPQAEPLFKILSNPDTSDTNLLHIAAGANLIHLLDPLTRDSTAVDATTSSGYTALHIAAELGHSVIFEKLLRVGADFQRRVASLSGERPTALMLAARAGHAEIAEILLRHLRNASVDHGMVMHLALESLAESIKSRSVSMVNAVLAYGIDINTILAGNVTVSQLAVEAVDIIMIRHLISVGAKFDSKLLHTVVSMGIQEGPLIAIVEAALTGSLGHLDRDICDSALYVAVYQSKIETTKLLIANGANVNYAPATEISQLHLAIRRNQWYTVQMLIDAGADVNLIAQDYGTPLQTAMRFPRPGFPGYVQGERDHDDIVSMLLSAGADGNIVSGEYGTALEEALQNLRYTSACILAEKFPASLEFDGQLTTKLRQRMRLEPDTPISRHIRAVSGTGRPKQKKRTGFPVLTAENLEPVSNMYTTRGADTGGGDSDIKTIEDWRDKIK